MAHPDPHPNVIEAPGAGHRARTPVTRGQPRFRDAVIDEIARQRGNAAAWQAAVERHGRDAAAAVDGEYAVGLCDAQGRSFLAVDRFASHGLCWRVVDGRLHWAERADELAAIEPRAELDPQSIYDYLYFHVIPSPRTAYRGVHRLPPGHSLWFEQGQPQLVRHWTPQFTESGGKGPNHTELGARFRDLVSQAVGRALDGSKPACFLSGGTDSSTVAGMASRLTGRTSTYSIGFDADGYDEMAYARIAARHFGTDHHEYYVTPDDLIGHMPDVARHYDQPFGNSSVLPAYCCARMAREDGVTRLLAGDGGDEFFGGNTRYAKQQVFGAYDTLPGLLRRGLLEPLLLHSPAGALPLLKKGRSYIQQAQVPMPARMHTYNLLERVGVTRVLCPDFLARVSTADTARQQREVWAESGHASLLNRMLAYDWRYTLAECDLPKVRGSTALAGVDAAFPMLDADLVDFSLGLPSDMKVRRLKLRWFFKQALRGFLPDEIIAKKKQGFGLPFGVWAASHTGLNRFAADALATLSERGIVRPDFIRPLIDEMLPSHPGYYGELVWILVMLELWLRGEGDGRATLP